MSFIKTLCTSVMNVRFENGHRARINIKNKFIADIVITPIKSIQDQNQKIEGYMVMLMDVTSQADEANNGWRKLGNIYSNTENLG